MHPAKLAASLLVLLALALGATPARAETVNCTAITALPAVITVQGVYCFTGNLATAITSGNAIDIQTNNVVLDLNGFKLGGLAAGTGTGAVGIHASNRQNITIKNGTIRGFAEGIFLPGDASQGHVIEGTRADQNTVEGIDVRGTGAIVRNNQVVATGGTTAFGPNASAFGIVVLGSGARVLNNDVIDTVPRGTGTGYAIFVSAQDMVVEGNRLSNATEGVSLQGVGDALVVNNRFTTMLGGIICDSGGAKFRDNLTSNVTFSFPCGTDAGNNN